MKKFRITLGNGIFDYIVQQKKWIWWKTVYETSFIDDAKEYIRFEVLEKIYTKKDFEKKNKLWRGQQQIKNGDEAIFRREPEFTYDTWSDEHMDYNLLEDENPWVKSSYTELPKGTIKKLIGRDLKYTDKPV